MTLQCQKEHLTRNDINKKRPYTVHYNLNSHADIFERHISSSL